MSKKQRRRNYPVIHRDRQFRVLYLILVYGLVICVYLFLCMFLPDIVKMQDPTEHWAARAHAADRILMMHNRLWPAVIAMLTLVGLHSFRMFSYLIGPLVPIRRALAKMAAGDFTSRLKIRKKDLLREEVELLNHTTEVLCDHIGKAQTAAHRAVKASAHLRELLADQPDSVREQLADAVNKVDHQVVLNCDQIDFFTIEAETEEPQPDGTVADMQPAGEHAG